MAAAFTSGSIEVTVLSGEELRIDRKLIRKNAFVVVRTESGSSQSTEADREGSGFPTWNEKLVLDFPANARALTLEVRCKTSSSGSRVVGIATVPVSDFIGGYVPEGYLHFLSYRLRDHRGEKNGIINISVRMKANHSGCSSSFSSCSAAAETIGVPVGESIGYGGGVVVSGVPVWCSAYSGRHF